MLLKLLLRVGGAMMMLAVVAMFMPREWMDAAHRRMGLGAFPDAPVAEYLARLTSGLYAFLGVLQWSLAANVVQWKRPIAVTAAGILLLTTSMAVLSITAGMPLWWALGDAATAVPYSLAILWLLPRAA